jgi:hypothetical protein
LGSRIVFFLFNRALRARSRCALKELAGWKPALRELLAALASELHGGRDAPTTIDGTGKLAACHTGGIYGLGAIYWVFDSGFAGFDFYLAGAGGAEFEGGVS